MASNFPASIWETISSKEIPLIFFNRAFFSRFQFKYFMFKLYDNVSLLSTGDVPDSSGERGRKVSGTPMISKVKRKKKISYVHLTRLVVFRTEFGGIGSVKTGDIIPIVLQSSGELIIQG